ncbi:MAG: HAMP domain-containing protein, partial [Nocardioides sp.]
MKLGLLVTATICVVLVLTLVSSAASVPWLLAVPVTIAVAVGVTQLLAAGMTSPLRQMTQAARQMAAGDYSGRVSTNARDEVGELASAFNKMAEELATVDRERRDLVANVSHEIRTPLAALSARLENLADGVEPADSDALEQLLGQVRRVSALVTDLLDLSRVDAGKSALRLSDVALADFLATAVEDVALPERGVRFDVRVEPPGLVVRADPHRLTQLVTNLVANAARHSPPGGLVRVCATAESATGWRLEVID